MSRITDTMSLPGPKKDFSEYLSTITSLPVETVLEDIRQCKSDATYAITNLHIPRQSAYLKKLKEGGLFAIILGHLKRCEDESFEDVLGEFAGQYDYIDSPLVWIIFLTNSVNHFSKGSDICVEIAENIDPLYKCMRDDMTRELFGSKKLWFQTINNFLVLCVNLVMNNSKVLSILLEKEGFLDMMIQSLFWPLTRPDIVGNECGTISPTMYMAPMRVLYYVVAKICGQLDDQGRERQIPNQERLDKDEMKQLVELGTKVIVSEAYDKTCDVTFMAGLLDLVKTSDPTAKQIWYYMLNEMATSGCVDNRVINRAVCHGNRTTLDSIDATMLPQVIFRLLHTIPPGDKHLAPLAEDNRYAVAIDAGLLQVCMKMLLQFETVYKNDLYGRFLAIINGASAIAFHPKTQKAIARVDKAELRRTLSKPELHRLGHRNEYCNKIFGAIAFFAKEAATPSSSRPNFGERLEIVCSSCSKELNKEDIKRCGQCKQRIYCSRDCQARDWKSGHKKECKLLQKQKDPVNSVFASAKNKLKIQKQTDQVLAEAREMFNKNIPIVLAWANINGYDVLDCVVVINFYDSPPSFDVQLAKDFLDNYRKEDTKAEMTAYIEKAKTEGALTINVVFCPATSRPGGEEAQILTAQMNFPGSSLMLGSWPATQQKNVEHLKEDDPDWLGPGHAYSFAGVRLYPGTSLVNMLPRGREQRQSRSCEEDYDNID